MLWNREHDGIHCISRSAAAYLDRRIIIIASNTDQPDAKNDLKSLLLTEIEKKLGSSPDGLTQVEAKKSLAQYGPKELEENQYLPEIPQLFLGGDPEDDKGGRDP